MIEIKVPAIGESISEVTLLKWTKKDGDYVERDEVIAEFESEKAMIDLLHLNFMTDSKKEE